MLGSRSKAFLFLSGKAIAAKTSAGSSLFPVSRSLSSVSTRRLSPKPKSKQPLLGSNNTLLNPKISLLTINNRFLIGTASGKGRSSSTAPADLTKGQDNNDVQKKDDKKETTEVTNKWENTKRLLMLIRAEMKLMIGALAALAVSSGTTLMFPAAIGRIIDIIANPASSALSLNSITLALAAIFAIGGLSSFIRINLMTIASERIVANLRKTVFAKIMKQDISFFDMRKTGELVNRLSSDTTMMGRTLVDNMAQGLRRIVEGIGGLGVLLYLSPKLTLTMLLVIPPVFFGAFWYGRMVSKLSKEQTDALARATSVAEEKISAVRTVRYFSQEQREISHYGEKINAVYQLAKRVGFASGAFFGSIWFLMNCALLAVLYHGSTLVLEGSMTPGALTSFLLYSLYVGFAFSGVSSFYSEFMRALGSSQRVFELLDREPDSTQSGSIKPDQIQGHIEFKDVTFSYPSRPDEVILKNLNLSLQPGKILAVVGSSGSGKSTVAGLVSRLYDPQEGQVTIDGVALRDLDAGYLRQYIGVVPQDVVLFSGSIAENIAYGTPGATVEQIQEAANQANAHDFIMSFSKGYETEVGERGVTLSGGQKQRIAIARAVLRNPKILLLDEATSALDVESEYYVQQALERLMHGRTVLVIAHRLSTIKDADAIAVLHKGSVAEIGTYDELMAQNGMFKQLVQRQEL